MIYNQKLFFPTFYILVFILVGILVFHPVSVQAVATKPNLLTAGDYVVIAGTGITNTGVTTITNGDVGSSPTTTQAGFGTVTIINGINHTTNDTATQQAVIDLTVAHTNALGQTPDVDYGATGEFGGRTYSPGVYKSGAGTLTGTTTLDGGGDPNAIFIFQTGSTLSVATSSVVTLINGAQSCNVFWAVGTGATLANGANLKGTIMTASVGISDSGANIEGRLMSVGGTIGLAGSTITKALCAPTISSVSIPNVAMKVGSIITATITTGTDTATYVLTSGTIGGFTLGNLIKTSATSYTAQFTVTNGGTDVVAAANIPIANLVLTRTGGSSSQTHSTPISQANDSIDANAPSAPTSVAVTPIGGTVVANTLNDTNTNLTATATIVAGQATGGSAILKVGATTLAADVSISALDTSVTFNLGLASTTALQAVVTTGGTVTVTLTDSAGNISISAVDNPTLTVDYIILSAPTSVTVTPIGGTVVVNTLNGTNINFTAVATIIAGQATGGSAILKVGATTLSADVSISALDTSVTFDLGLASTTALQEAVTTGGTVTVTLTNSGGNTTISAVNNPTLTVSYVTIGTPTPNLDAGAYTATQNIVLTSAGSTSIRYTIDGTTTPTCSVGTLYAGAISLTATMTINTVGCDSVSNISSVVTLAYTVTLPIPPTPTPAPSGGGGGGGGGYFPTPTPIPTPAPMPASTLVTTPVTATLSIPAVEKNQAKIVSEQMKNIVLQNKKLSRGDKNDDVKALQQFLISQNKGVVALSLEKATANGMFGPLTQKALAEFQNSVGIKPAKGIFGAITKNFIKNLPAFASASTPTFVRTPTQTPAKPKKEKTKIVSEQMKNIVLQNKKLSWGDKNDDVKALQQFLISQNKGVVALSLEKATANGVFGPLTQKALAEFQNSVGIKLANGIFEARTKNFIKNL